MFLVKVLFSFSLLHLIDCDVQINLHRTHEVSLDDHSQYHCLQVPAYVMKESDPRQIISYCLGEYPFKFTIKQNNRDPKFTFEQLAKQNITNQQLYLWSAPIDLIEQYQFYLNQLNKTSPDSLLRSEVFYNCTFPSFGPQCEYILEDYQPYHSSLDEIVHDYYRYNKYEPNELTCYVHLECDRGSSLLCLDWREICDGKIDCLDGGLDEEHCWIMEMQDYDEIKDPIGNKECISRRYFRDDSNVPPCIGESTLTRTRRMNPLEDDSLVRDPSFEEEDISCTKMIVTQFDKRVNSYECFGIRLPLLHHLIFSIKPKWLSDQCWSAIRCTIFLMQHESMIFSKLCVTTGIFQIINATCPNMIMIPRIPLFFGHVYAVYNKSELMEQESYILMSPSHFCYNDELLHVPNSKNKTMTFNNLTCHIYEYVDDPTTARAYGWFLQTVYPLYIWLRRHATSLNENLRHLNQSMIYQCNDWPKNISRYYLSDNIVDCPFGDDEYRRKQRCVAEQNKDSLICPSTKECIPPMMIRNQECDCEVDFLNFCPDEDPQFFHSLMKISFQTICDDYPHLHPMLLNDSNRTDETDCEDWPLIHIYNHCDGYWDTSDGSDELNCDPTPLLNCSNTEHICVSPQTNQLMCLSMNKSNDGIIDCVGGADEPRLCQDYFYRTDPRTFYCEKDHYAPCIAFREICDNDRYCLKSEDEEFCQSGDLAEASLYKGICTKNYESDGSDVAKVICRRFSFFRTEIGVHFTLDQWSDGIKRHSKQNDTPIQQSLRQKIERYQPRCHRGLNLQIWVDKEKNQSENICFCPPSYYGADCEYQNERVSLSLEFKVSSDSRRTPFAVVVYLIEETNERIIHSVEQLSYLALENCRRRFDLYLLYSHRPKDQSKDYLIQIDIYERETLNYRGSWIKSLNYTFLPVHRLILSISIPHSMNNENECVDDRCEHGKCRKYVNDGMNRTFCQCDEEWSGRFCDHSFSSMCSSESLSVGQLSQNRSICICPSNKIGPRCLIDDNICQSTTCMNNGKCLSIDEYQTSRKRYLCICSRDFTGDHCEISRNELILAFDENVDYSSVILIHLIEVRLDESPVRTTTFKKIPFGQSETRIYWSLPFHLVFIEFLDHSYYLVHVNKTYKESTMIRRRISSSDRCLNVSELLDESLVNSSLLHRMKSYHNPCQRNGSELKCFVDEIHLCLCQEVNDGNYVTNCLEFDHGMKSDCSGENSCLNDGECFEEQTSCPRISICKCSLCFYGSQCQLSTNGFTLSLDSILGYHIQPFLSLNHQPLPVLISFILMIVITLLGFINALLTFITFHNKITHESGCGFYLLTSSIVIISTMIVFLLKFLILLLSQMGIIRNELFLRIECHSMDFLLRFCLTMDQWLTAFVTVERTSTIIKRANFNKNKSKLVAKYAIFGLIVVSILTNIHDPIYRRLFEENNNDDEMKRIWCIVNYSPVFRILNLVISIIHFICPFIVNVISAIVIIVMSTRQQIAIKKKKKKYGEIVKEQLEQHRHLLIGPCVLIILAIPRLILSFASGCMKSDKDSWLFLMGYFISLIPPLLTFILFVLPSTTYKKAFRQVISRYRNLIRRHQ